MKKLYIFTFILIFVNNFLFSQQKDGISKSDTLPEVSVSAKTIQKINVLKLEVPSTYLPVAISNISAKTLEMRGVQDLQQLAQFLPGIRIRTSYGAFQQINIRGFEHSVVMVDGVRDERSAIDNSYPFPDLSSVQSVELIKGPASVLYGQSTVGGVLNITRKEPVSQKNLNARISLGSFDYRQASMSMGGALVGTVNYFASINFSDKKGWRDTGDKRFSGYLALQSSIGEKGILDFRGGFNRDYYGTEIGLPATMPADIYTSKGDELYLKAGEMQPGLNRKARYNNESDFFYNNGENLSLQYKHLFSDALKLTNKISYVNDDINYFGTEELSYLTSDNPIYKHYYKVGDKKKYIALDTVQLTFPLRFSHMAQTINNQFELSGKFNTGKVIHNYLAGYSFQSLIRNSFSGYNLGVDVKGPGLFSKVDAYEPHSMGYMTSSFGKVAVMRTVMHGFYIHDLVEVSDKLKVLLAGRYDYFAYRRADTKTIDGERRFEMPASDAFNKVNSAGLTYRVGFVYFPVKSFSVYASSGSYLKPYRTFFNEKSIYIDRDGKEFYPESGKTVFKPEQGNATEAGIRYELNDKWSFSTNWFYINKVNTVKTLARIGDIITKPNGTTVTLDKNVVGQVGTMDSKGFDVDVTANPYSNLSFRLGYGYTDARVREIKQNDYLQTEELKDKPNTYVPAHTFYAYGSYTLERGWFKNLNFNIHATYQDEVYRNVKTNLVFPAYWLCNAGVLYPINPKTNVSLTVNNIFDTVYWNQSLGNQLVPSMPRNFLVSVAFSY